MVASLAGSTRLALGGDLASPTESIWVQYTKPYPPYRRWGLTAATDSRLDVLSVRVERSRPAGSGSTFREGPGPDELTRSSLIDAQLSPDLLHRAALRTQFHRLLVEGQARGSPVVAQTLPRLKSCTARQPLPPHRDTAEFNLLRGLAELRLHSVQHSLDVVAKIAQQVPTVRDLFGRWERDLDRFGVRTGTVSSDDLDGGVGAQPFSYRGRLPAFEHLDRFAALEIYNDCPVAVTTRDRPVIDAHDPGRSLSLACPCSSQFPQHGSLAGMQSQVRRESCRRRPTKGMAQRTKRSSLRSRSALMSTGQAADVLGKSAPRATGAHALEATRLDRKNNLLLKAGAFG